MSLGEALTDTALVEADAKKVPEVTVEPVTKFGKENDDLNV